MQSFLSDSKDAEEKNRELERLKEKYTAVIAAWENEGIELTPIEWSHYFETGRAEVYSVWRTIDILAERSEERISSSHGGQPLTGSKTAESLRALRRSLCDFTQQELGCSFGLYTFEDISERFLLDYACYVRKKGTAENNRGNLRTRLKELMRVFRFAAETNIAKPDMSLFESLKPYVEHTKRLQQPLTPNTVEQIAKLGSEYFTRVEQFHIDLFLFCYYAGGISNVEVSYLKRSAVRNNILTYTSKTGKEVKVPLINKAHKILDKYERTCYADHLLPIFTHKHSTESKQRERMKRLCDGVNHTLKKAGRLIGYDSLIVWSSAKAAFIAKMLEAGFHPIAIAHYAGVSVDTVYKYCPEQPREKDVLEQMNSVFGESES